MALTFVDTHNMIAYLTKSDASERFDQIIDFLNGRSIKYALTINPNIYVSCIQQFWTSVSMKKVNDVTRLQDLVVKKKVIITEATIRNALRFNDVESINCLPNEEIFTELSRMEYEKPSTKLTFYKVFFSPQWKFLIHTILQCVSAKRTSWNEFSSSMALAVICLSTGKGFSGVDTPLFEGMLVVQQVDESAAEINVDDVPTAGVADEGVADVNVDVVCTAVDEPSIPSPTPPTQPPPPSQDLPFDFSSATYSTTIPNSSTTILSTTTTIFTGCIYLNGSSLQAVRHMVKKLEMRNKLKVLKLRRLKKVGTAQRVETSNDTIIDNVSKHGRIILDMDADVDVSQKDIAKDVVVDAEIKEKPAKLQEAVEVVTTAKLITGVVTAASATITVVSPQLTTVAAPTLTTAPSAARRRKGVVIRDPKETAAPSTIIHSEAKSKDKGKGILAELNKKIDWDEVIEQVQRKEKEDNVVMRYQALKRKPQTEAQARKNMMIYLRNVAGFKMDYFKGMTYDDIHPIFENKFKSNVAFLQKTKEQMEEEDNKALKRLSQEDKTAKRQKLDEEVEELRKHLQIVLNDDDDDVYTKATPLALKVPIDYEIYTKNNKPYNKIKRADGTHQLYLSFLRMLRNFDREDLEVLWQLVKERFASSKPKNVSDDFLLTTLRAIFEKPDIQAQI
nr:hypothetical protein [Tanacetum cinerariifolium]GEW07987.1 hypothetical protein [Tanacetum cinerariifolium]